MESGIFLPLAPSLPPQALLSYGTNTIQQWLKSHKNLIYLFVVVNWGSCVDDFNIQCVTSRSSFKLDFSIAALLCKSEMPPRRCVSVCFVPVYLVLLVIIHKPPHSCTALTHHSHTHTHTHTLTHTHTHTDTHTHTHTHTHTSACKQIKNHDLP